MNLIKLNIRIVSLLAFISCSQLNHQKIYQQVRDHQAILIDIREHDEIKEGKVKDAVWIPLSDLNSQPESVIQKIKALSQGKDIYIYCRSGKRSEIFLQRLKERGLPGENLGGYQDLISQGFPSDKP